MGLDPLKFLGGMILFPPPSPLTLGGHGTPLFRHPCLVQNFASCSYSLSHKVSSQYSAIYHGICIPPLAVRPYQHATVACKTSTKHSFINIYGVYMYSRSQYPLYSLKRLLKVSTVSTQKTAVMHSEKATR